MSIDQLQQNRVALLFRNQISQEGLDAHNSFVIDVVKNIHLLPDKGENFFGLGLLNTYSLEPKERWRHRSDQVRLDTTPHSRSRG